jgi:hypothetical protein
MGRPSLAVGQNEIDQPGKDELMLVGAERAADIVSALDVA